MTQTSLRKTPGKKTEDIYLLLMIINSTILIIRHALRQIIQEIISTISRWMFTVVSKVRRVHLKFVLGKHD